MQLSTLPHIVVATPGRLADYLRDSPEVISLKNLKFLVCLS
jgi:superfamily II DNA/RNA helicase